MFKLTTAGFSPLILSALLSAIFITACGGSEDNGVGTSGDPSTSVGKTAGPTSSGPTVTASFVSTTAEIANPERGLSQLWENLSDLNGSWLASHYNAGYRLVTHRQLLGNYAYTPTLPQSFLDALNAGAALHRAQGTKMIMQFSYDNVGGGAEPSLSTILGHIAQLKPFFTTNADVIAAVHGGFLGWFGEWAYGNEPTVSAYDPSVGASTPTPAARAAVRDALLAAVDKSTHIGWRTLNDVMTWYPTPLSASQAWSGSNQSRSGVHNDCFLSNKDDSGTYWKPGIANTDNTLNNPFRLYHTKAASYTTMGGETCYSAERTACADVLAEGPMYRWRYLRDDWGVSIHDGWKAQGCYPQIKRSLGYRFQLDSVSHQNAAARGESITVNMNLRNVGWSRIFSARKLVVTLRHKTSGATITGTATTDMRTLDAQAASSTSMPITVTIPASAAAGDYDVYVGLPDAFTNLAGDARFAVRFANADNPGQNQAWDASTARLRVGTTVTVQ